MNIGIDASRSFIPQRTGTENYSFNLIKSLLETDKKNKYTLYLNNMEKSLESSLFNVSEISTKDRGDDRNVSSRIIKLPRLWTQLGLAFECLVDTPDILFVPAHTLPVIRKPSLKTVVTIHDLGYEYLKEFHTFPNKIYLNWSTIYASRFASHIIAVSEATKKDLFQRFSINPEKVSVIYEGYNQELFRPIRIIEAQGKVEKKYGLKNDYILFVGTIQPRKNLIRLIEGFSLLARKIDKVDLVLVGKPGWLNEEIYKHPKKLRLEKRVHFLNYVPDNDLPDLYSAAKVFALPSLYEGFGLPVIEAMACGCPVVTSATSSLGEIGGDATILVDPYNVEEISASLYRVISENDLRRSLVSKGLKRVERFSWKNCAIETLEVFEKVYENKNS